MTITTRIRKKLDRHFPKKCPDGMHAKYVQISHSRGIKVFKGVYPTATDLFGSNSYSLALDEIHTLRRAKQQFECIPNCYGLQIVKLKCGFVIGIVLQHLGSIRLYDSAARKSNKDLIIVSKLETALEKAGIKHLDVHNQNIMCYRGKYWVIDFGTESVRFVNN